MKWTRIVLGQSSDDPDAADIFIGRRDYSNKTNKWLPQFLFPPKIHNKPNYSKNLMKRVK